MQIKLDYFVTKLFQDVLLENVEKVYFLEAFWSRGSVPAHGGELELVIFKVPSNSTHSMIL